MAIYGSAIYGSAIYGAPVFGSYEETVLSTPDLLSYWKLDETSGTVVDETGSVTGTNNGATPGVAGIVTNTGTTAYSFDGVNDSLDFGNVHSATGIVQLSVELWYAPAVLDGTFRRLISKDWFVSGSNRGGWAVTIDTGNKLRFFRASPIATSVLTTTATLEVGVAQHIVATYDGVSMRLYRNGALIGSIESSVSIPNTDLYPLTIGKRPDVANEYASGVMDEVSVYNRALTDAEILDRYQAGIAASSTGNIYQAVAVAGQGQSATVTGRVRAQAAATAAQTQDATSNATRILPAAYLSGYSPVASATTLAIYAASALAAQDQDAIASAMRTVTILASSVQGQSSMTVAQFPIRAQATAEQSQSAVSIARARRRATAVSMQDQTAILVVRTLVMASASAQQGQTVTTIVFMPATPGRMKLHDRAVASMTISDRATATMILEDR